MVLCAAVGWACGGFSAVIRFTLAATILLNKKAKSRGELNRYSLIHTVKAYFLIQSNG
jgi:hypothetical protein